MHLLVDTDVLFYKACFSPKEGIDVMAESESKVPSYFITDFDKQFLQDYVDADTEKGLVTMDPKELYKLALQTVVSFKLHYWSMVKNIRQNHELKSVIHCVSPSDRGTLLKTLHHPEYKAGRHDRPDAFHILKSWFFKAHENKYMLKPEYEADDLLATYSLAYKGETIVASIDKDLRQIAGHHYNMTTRNLDYVDLNAASKQFYTLVLQGDRIDNVPGLFQHIKTLRTEVKANEFKRTFYIKAFEKFMAVERSIEQLHVYVKDLYIKWLGEQDGNKMFEFTYYLISLLSFETGKVIDIREFV